jgi:hypothetical protein
MKKIVAGVFFVIMISNANAESIFDTYWNFGNIGIGTNYSSKDDDNMEVTVSIFNLAFEHKYTNIGIEINPFKYWLLEKFQNEIETQENGVKYSFINTSIYWDLIENYTILFGPFASINYMYLTPLSGLNMNEYIFSGGLRFSLKTKDLIYGYNPSQIVNAEIGYRNIMGKNKFYCSVNMDVILLLMIIGNNYYIFKPINEGRLP